MAEVQGVNFPFNNERSMHMKGRLYRSCERCAMLYGSNTLPVKDDVKRLECTVNSISYYSSLGTVNSFSVLLCTLITQ